MGRELPCTNRTPMDTHKSTSHGMFTRAQKGSGRASSLVKRAQVCVVCGVGRHQDPGSERNERAEIGGRDGGIVARSDSGGDGGTGGLAGAGAWVEVGAVCGRSEVVAAPPFAVQKKPGHRASCYVHDLVVLK